MWTSEIDAMRRYGCLLMLCCHPFLSGRPSRIEGLRKVIEHALGAGDVTFAQARTIAHRATTDPELDVRRLAPVQVDHSLYESSSGDT